MTECSDPTAVKETLYDSRSRRTIDGLLDLISLEGIYPNLSPGVGVPIERRVRSVLQGGTTTKAFENEQKPGLDRPFLREIVTQLMKIARSSGKGLSVVLQERTLVDLIAALGQLALYPSVLESRDQEIRDFKFVLDVYVPNSFVEPGFVCTAVSTYQFQRYEMELKLR